MEGETVLGAGAKKQTKAAREPVEEQPDLEEGGVPEIAKQKDVFYQV